MPQIATTDDDINKCFAVISELRPHLSKENFLPSIREMVKQGYTLAFIQDNNKVMSVAGYRISTNLFMGKNLYVDDLVTTQTARSQGYGETMISWLRTIAHENKCTHLHLDSGSQRFQAHRFYFKQNLVITSYHFSEELI